MTNGVELGLVMYDHTHCTSMIKLWLIITVIFKQEIIFKKLEQVKSNKSDTNYITTNVRKIIHESFLFQRISYQQFLL